MTELLFHTTRNNKSFRRIMKSGVLKGTMGVLSLTHNPAFGTDITFEGHTFVFPADVIYEKYGGKDVIYPSKSEDVFNYANEEEVEVRVSLPVSEAIEILPSMAAYRKYAAGQQYNYKDSRELKELPYSGYHFRTRKRDIRKYIEEHGDPLVDKSNILSPELEKEFQEEQSKKSTLDRILDS